MTGILTLRTTAARAMEQVDLEYGYGLFSCFILEKNQHIPLE